VVLNANTNDCIILVMRKTPVSKCERCYGRGHGVAECIAVEKAGLNQVRPKCRTCFGLGKVICVFCAFVCSSQLVQRYGHNADYCPSNHNMNSNSNNNKSAASALIPSASITKCARCEGKKHSEDICTSPVDAAKNRIKPRCESWTTPSF
jgi:hypothetical protein